MPQIIKILRTKKADDLSLTSWILWTITALANTIYSLVMWRSELIIASISELLMIGITLILTLKYSTKDNKVRR